LIATSGRGGLRVVRLLLWLVAVIPMTTLVWSIPLLVCGSRCVADVSKWHVIAVIRRRLFPLGFGLFGFSVVIDEDARPRWRDRRVDADW
jgi:hypothetical protein